MCDSEVSMNSTEDNIYHSLSEEDEVSQHVSDSPQPTSKRTRKPPEWYGFTNLCVSDQLELCAEDITYKEATEGPEKEKWQKAMCDELQAFDENQAWEIVDIKESGRVVQCRWVFKKKLECDDSVRYRARLVAKGFTQQQGVKWTLRLIHQYLGIQHSDSCLH